MMHDLPRNCWYPLFRSRDLTRRPARIERFGVMWVVYRDAEGTAVMAEDRCPHLGASLAGGHIRDGLLECPFHGFLFDSDGRLKRVPAMGREARLPGKLCLKMLHTREDRGWIFGWWGDRSDSLPELPSFPDIDHRFVLSDISVLSNVHVTRAIENQLDVAHLPFVHGRTIGSRRRPRIKGPFTEIVGEEIRVWAEAVADNDTPLEEPGNPAEQKGKGSPRLIYRFPCLWQLRIHERMKLMVGFVPVNENKTLFMIRACHTVKMPFIGTIYGCFLSFMNRIILREDLRVIESIRPLSSMDAVTDQFMPADRAIIQFRKLWRSRVSVPHEERL